VDMELGLDEDFVEEREYEDEGEEEKESKREGDADVDKINIESEKRHRKLVEGIAVGKFVTYKYIGERDGVPLGPKVSCA
jgi:hypothetical protein